MLFRLLILVIQIKKKLRDFVKEEGFDNKLKNINKKVTLSKTKHVLAQSELSKLSEKVKLTSTKGSKQQI